MNRTISTTVAAALAALLTACAGSPMRVAASDATTLQAESSDALCAAYGFGMGKEKARAELERRNALNDREWQAADARKVFVGMSRTAALCAWGKPERMNGTTTAAGRSEQWVYTCGAYGRGCSYLYVRNGVVSAIQN